MNKATIFAVISCLTKVQLTATKSPIAELDANPDPNSTEKLASATCFDLLILNR